MRKVGALSNGMILVEMTPAEFGAIVMQAGDTSNCNSRRTNIVQYAIAVVRNAAGHVSPELRWLAEK